MGDSVERYRKITPINRSLGSGDGSNKVLLFQGQLNNLLGNNPELIASGAKLLYSAKALRLTCSWHIKSGQALDAFLRPDGFITPQTIDNVNKSRLLTFWIAPPRKAPFRFHEILLMKNEGYRIQQADLLERVRTIPLGEDVKFFVSIENTGGGPLTSGDNVVIQGEVEESLEVISSVEGIPGKLDSLEAKLGAQLEQINLKLSNLQIGSTGAVQAATLTEVIYRDAAWKAMYFSGDYIWKTDPETAVGKLQIGYLVTKNKLYLAISGGLESARPDRLIRVRARADNTILVSFRANDLLNQNTDSLKPITLDTSGHAGIESYLEFEDTDSGSYYSWFGVGMNFWVE